MHGFTDKMSEFDLESKQKDKEILDLKAYYEDRIAHLTNNFNFEKSRIITENEKNIEKYFVLINYCFNAGIF